MSGDIILEIDRKSASELIEKLAKFVVDRKLAPAAILAIESLRPLNFIGSQMLYAVAPFAEVIFNPKEYQEFAALLENREYLDLLLRRIDELDDETYRAQRKEARFRKKQKKELRHRDGGMLKKKVSNIINKITRGKNE